MPRDEYAQCMAEFDSNSKQTMANVAKYHRYDHSYFENIVTNHNVFEPLQKKPDWSKKGGEGEKKVKDGDGEDSGAEA
ncbi:MAG: hypothetical protein RPT12_17270 [Vibrio anguillarum]|nr:hypothetical protein [Vibrio anguillarum]